MKLFTNRLFPHGRIAVRIPIPIPVALGAMVGLAGLIVAGVVWQAHRQPVATVPAALRDARTRGLTVYYPSALPQGWQADASTATVTDTVSSYALTHGAARMVVTFQPKPADVMFDDFYTRVLEHKADVFNRYGKAAVGLAGGKTLGSLVTDTSWVLVTASEATDAADVSDVLAHLAPLR